jgi:hypothetical protein
MARDTPTQENLMENLTLHELRRLWRARYDDLTQWLRIDLERYAIALTHSIALRGATKIRLLRTILHAEIGGWPTV